MAHSFTSKIGTNVAIWTFSLLFFLITSLCHGQNRVSTDSPVLINCQGFNYRTVGFDLAGPLSAEPFLGTGIGNPAQLAELRHFTIGGSWQWASPVKQSWIAGIGHYYAHPEIPLSVSAVYPFQKLNVGYTFQQRYNMVRDYGTIEATIIEETEDGYATSTTVHPTSEELLLQHAFTFAADISEYVPDNHRVSIGGQVHYNQFFLNKKTSDAIAPLKKRMGAPSWTFGAMYQMPALASWVVRLSGYYESKITISQWVRYEEFRLRIRGEMHPRAHFGFLLQSPTSWWLSSHYTVAWTPDGYSEGVWGKYHRQYFSMGWNWTSQLRNSIILMWERPVDMKSGTVPGNFSDEPNVMDAMYIFARFSYDLGPSRWSLMVGDSHLGSGEWRKQTLARIGMDYRWK